MLFRSLEGDNRQVFEREVALVEKLKPIAAKAGFSMAQLAIKFVLGHVAVSVVIPGAKNRQQLEQNQSTSFLPAPTHEEFTTIEQILAG